MKRMLSILGVVLFYALSTISGHAQVTSAGSPFGGSGGAADTAVALASNPADCAANTFANAIAASGDLTCTAVPFAATTGTASSAQGSLADTALQPADVGTAAAEDVGAFATAAQGALADTALQPASPAITGVATAETLRVDKLIGNGSVIALAREASLFDVHSVTVGGGAVTNTSTAGLVTITFGSADDAMGVQIDYVAMVGTGTTTALETGRVNFAFTQSDSPTLTGAEPVKVGTANNTASGSYSLAFANSIGGSVATMTVTPTHSGGGTTRFMFTVRVWGSYRGATVALHADMAAGT